MMLEQLEKMSLCIFSYLFKLKLKWIIDSNKTNQLKIHQKKM